MSEPHQVSLRLPKDREEYLCYVDPPFAYFTTQPLDQQWGDDWDDAPYEHNAGDPYPYLPDHDKDEEPWQIKKVAYTADLQTPAEYSGGFNSRFSVEQINKGRMPWLVTPSWLDTQVFIPAGIDLEEFYHLVNKAGGTVYTPQPKKRLAH